MSHTTRVEGVDITDIGAVRAAINELAKTGVQVSLEEGGTPRAYFSNQSGLGKADYVIRLANGRYDVGLYKSQDGKRYEPRCDFFGGDIARQLGSPTARNMGTSSMRSPQEALGRFLNLYAVHAITRRAAMEGRNVQRKNNEDGSVRLVVK